MGEIKRCLEKLRAIRDEEGYGTFDNAIRILNRERLQNPGRDERKQFSKADKEKKYREQKGICPICEKFMDPKYRYLEMDHIDPNRQDFNAWDNLQLVHNIPCNRSKGAKSIYRQSKENGRTFNTIIKPNQQYENE